MTEQKIDWNLAPKAAFAYEKVGKKCFWQCFIGGRIVSVSAPRFKTNERMVWLNGVGSFDTTLKENENEKTNK